MEIKIVKNYDEMSQVAADVIKDVITNNPNAVLGLATGSSPIGTYKRLIHYCNSGEISFKNVKTVNLDEYVGLGEESDQSYVYFMNDNLFNHVDIDKASTNLPNGKASDLSAECLRYNALVKSLRQDVQVLGLGSNGHIGFNEPGTAFDSITHIVDLAESTINDNSRLFEKKEDVPRQAITMGVTEIMQAKKILMVVSGKNKADAVYKLSKGPVDESCPASILQKHPNVLLVVDEAAASLL